MPDITVVGSDKQQCHTTGKVNMLIISKNLKGRYSKERDRVFSRICCDITRGNDFKLEEGRFRLGIRKKSSIVRVVRHWNSVVDDFQVRLDQALGNMI